MEPPDNFFVCLICREDYTWDVSSSDESQRHHLPVQSQACSHTFCYGCILQHQNAQSEQKKVIKWLKCPECRTKTAFCPEKPVWNLMLCGFVEVRHSKHSSAKVVGRDGEADSVEPTVDLTTPQSQEGTTTRSHSHESNTSTKCNKKRKAESANEHLVWVAKTKEGQPAFLIGLGENDDPETFLKNAVAKGDNEYVDIRWATTGKVEKVHASFVRLDDGGMETLAVSGTRRSKRNATEAAVISSKSKASTEEAAGIGEKKQCNSDSSVGSASGQSDIAEDTAEDGTEVRQDIEGGMIDDAVEVIEEDNAPLCGPSRVKLELFSKASIKRTSANYEQRKRRSQLRLKWSKTPQGSPRKVFRRGCHRHTITQVLGGSGMHPSPIVKRPPAVDANGGNPFIQPCEYYFAGRSDWNPWTPAFPGDVGFVWSDLVEQSCDQQEKFHMFLQCAKRAYEPHYHGPDAKGKYLYIGEYRVVPHDNSKDLQETGRSFMYSSLSFESQRTIAKYFRKYDADVAGKNEDGEIKVASNENLTEAHHKKAKETLESEEQGSWAALSQEKREVHAWVQMLLDVNYKINVLPVEPVGYNEDLYSKLVETGADNGEVATDSSKLGPL